MPRLDVLCAGAAKGLLLALETPFAQANGGALINAEFGAVGALRDALRAGAPCDVLILTEALLAALEQSGDAQAGTRLALGRVSTGVAVVAGAARPDIANRAALEQALCGASALYVPDATRSTAGAHVAAMLQSLGVAVRLDARLRMFPNGAAAMHALAASADAAAIGCTQITEIRYTPGLDLAGALPEPFALSTGYGAAVAGAATDAALAERLVAMLGGRASAALRREAGFEIAS